jgi:AraC-like DNA-binding protein
MLMEQARRRSLADVATEAGFYDQSHLTRDFAALAGVTPAAFAADAKDIPEVRFVQDADEMVPA